MKIDISFVRECIANGMSNDEIEDAILEAEAAMEEDRKRYGDEYEDTRSTREKEMCDRLDMGRNDAGEWLGFM